MESFEINGIWWLPENENKKVSGTLKFDPVEGASLELIGSFKEPKDLAKVLEPNIILGVGSKKIITLYRCYETNTNLSVPGLMNSSFIADFIFLGHHFNKEEDVVFESLSVNYPFLEMWSGKTGFQYKLDMTKEHHLDKYTVCYSYPDKVEVSLDDCDVSFDYAFGDGGDRFKDFKMNHTTFIKLRPSSEMVFTEYLKRYFYHLENFLSLAIGQVMYPLKVKGKNSNCKTLLKDSKTVLNDIEIYYSSRKAELPLKKIHPMDMLFCYPDIASKFKDCLSNWFSKIDKLSPVYDLYFATLYNPTMYLQHKFLSLVQAIESYHRRNFSGEYVSREIYAPIWNTLKDAIPEGVNPDFRASLKHRMQYLYEYSLRKRLKDIVDALGDTLNPVIPDKGAFIEDLYNTRNYLTHYDEDLKAKAKDGKELHKRTQQLKGLIEICLLKEIGFEKEDILKILSKKRK